MNEKGTKACVAMVCVTALEIFAIWKGVNGVSLAAAVGAICGLGGYAIGSKT